jgi:DNA polymerase-3 subunit beta
MNERIKFCVAAKPLAAALGRLANLVDKRSPIAIVNHARIAAAEEALSLTATDLDLQLTIKLEAEVAEAGATTAPIDLLRELSRRLESSATFETTEGRLILCSGRGRFRLPTLPAEDFPLFTVGQASHQFRMRAADLRRLLDRTVFAAAEGDRRYYLCGVFLHIASNALRAVATNGHRLAWTEVALPAGAAEMPGVILPRKAAEHLLPPLNGRDGEAEVVLSASGFWCDTGDAILTSKLVDGTFPDYERVIPSDHASALLVDAGALAAAIERVALLCGGKTRVIALTAAEDASTLSTTDGEGEEQVEGQLTGPSVRVAFNSQYVLDCLKHLDAAWIEFTDAGRPIILRDPADSGTLFVVTPCRA